MLDALSSAAEITRARPSLAVLPIGSIEQHSRHLPLGTDWIAATALAHRVGAELGALVLPALPVSMGRCHKPMAGTVWLRPMTLADAVSDVIRSVAAAGIRHVLIVNGHGGNFTLEVATRELNMTSPELNVLLAQESVRQLRQRITFQYRLRALEREEIASYITHRLRAAGYRGPGLFDRASIRVLHRASGGVPRLVNIVAHKAMLLAYGEGEQEVGARHVHAAVSDTPAAKQSRWSWLRLVQGRAA